MTTPAPSVPSTAFAFDVAACDAIVAEHYPNRDAASSAWQASEYRANPARYDDPGTCLEALAQAERLLDNRIMEHEIRLNEPEPWPEEPSSWCDRQPVNLAELKAALREMVRASKDEAELRTLIAADPRFVGEPAIHIEPGYRGAFLSPSSTMIMIHASHNGETVQI